MKNIALLLASAAFVSHPALAQENSAGEITIEVQNALELEDNLAPSINWYQGYASERQEGYDGLLVTEPVESDSFGLAWSGSGRWGLTLDVTRRNENPVLPEEEINAGAYFQLTPRFRFGGGIRLTDKAVNPSTQWAEENEGEADVRIESAFSF